MKVDCPYCQKPAEFLSCSAEIYHGRDFGPVYVCRPCDARVGCHKGTAKPLGRLANAELRRWKERAHNALDSLWKHGGVSRREAYKLLSEWLEIDKNDCHIGMFDIPMCKRVVEFARAQ